ncbi:MAG: hypothetical protein M3004_00025 [Bacteroidota bacterium]|nr:hypothetical protein [Bacteroidota bacterium]
MIKIFVFVIAFISFHSSYSQHIEYRDKRKIQGNVPPPSGTTTLSPINHTPPKDKQPIATSDTVVVNKPVVIKPTETKDTAVSLSTASLSRNANMPGIIRNKKMPELITGCNLSAPPDKMPQLPIVINDVAPELVAKLKERYKNRIYSITGLNMIDVRLKLKLKICDKDGAKFRIEYLDKDGNIVNDPNLDYFEF